MKKPQIVVIVEPEGSLKETAKVPVTAQLEMAKEPETTEVSNKAAQEAEQGRYHFAA